MTNDLETMLRASLQERAEDVEPTPELWQQVQRRVGRRRAMPLLVWTAAGVAAAVTAVAVVPGLLDGAADRFTIEPGESISPTEGTDVDPAPGVPAPLSHYVAVVDGRLVLRGLDGSESVLWEGESEVRTVAVRPGTTADEPVVATVTSAEGMLDLRVHGDGNDLAVPLGPDPGAGAVVPTPVWSPDGSTIGLVTSTGAGTDLVLLEPYGDADLERQPVPGDLEDPTALRLQDWADVAGEGTLSFTSLGVLYRAPVGRVGEGWDVGTLERADGDGYVVDIATASDGRQYRLLAGVGVTGEASGDAEDAGLALEFGNERVPFRDLATASPADVWMTAVDGGAFVGLGSEARLVLFGPSGELTQVSSVAGVSYAAWIDGAVAPTAPADPAPSAPATDLEAYVAVDAEGRVAVHAGDGGEREVIVDERLWAPEAAVSVQDVTVRPGSTPGEVAGMLLLATEGGPELAWFRAAAGATATARLEPPIGLGEGDTEQRDAPTWSPDGLHIAWVEPSGDGGWTLRTLGMADNGPTSADAAFGLDIDAERLRVARWTWLEGGDGVTARGEISLVAPAGEYVVPVERQGDGALAVGSPRRMSMEGVPGDEFLDFGARGDLGILLVREGDRIVLWQEGPAELPVADPSDLDLDVLDDGAVVTDRTTGEAWAVDRAGGVTPLDGTVFGFDPVR